MGRVDFEQDVKFLFIFAQLFKVESEEGFIEKDSLESWLFGARLFKWDFDRNVI